MERDNARVQAWNAASKCCDGGLKFRTRYVESARHGGTDNCAAVEYQACGTTPCRNTVGSYFSFYYYYSMKYIQISIGHVVHEVVHHANAVPMYRNTVLKKIEQNKYKDFL